MERGDTAVQRRPGGCSGGITAHKLVRQGDGTNEGGAKSPLRLAAVGEGEEWTRGEGRREDGRMLREER